MLKLPVNDYLSSLINRAELIFGTLKVFVVSILITSIFTTIGFIFWQTDLKYSQPTPVPVNYMPPSQGEAVRLEGIPLQKDKPTLLHFFNPACPCSKFNFDHFRSLAIRYAEDVTFVVVLQDLEKEEAIAAFEDYGMNVPALYDQDGQLAKTCGVYATPQAVLLDGTGKIYYRGNYNKSRYCTIPGSNYTQMALDSLLANKTIPQFEMQAYRPYGCQLPSDNPDMGQSLFDFAL